MKLYHGTSQDRLASILDDQRVERAPYGDMHISFTTDIAVAEYFANLAASSDESTPAIIATDTLVLDEAEVPYKPFSSDVWGEGECDWEKEVAVLEDLSTDLIVVLK